MASNEEVALKKFDLKVKEIMEPGPVTIPDQATITQAASVMKKQDSSCVLVESKGKIVGVLTEQDITRRVAAKGSPPGKTRVKSAMTSPIVVIPPEARIEEALRVMITNKVRRLPVVDEKGLAGLVSVVDIAKALAEKAGYTTSLIQAMAKESLPPSGIYV